MRHALLIEHGCEKTHNDYFSGYLSEMGLDPNTYGWASLQGDGGVASVKAKVTEWFASRLPTSPLPVKSLSAVSQLGIGVMVRPTAHQATGPDRQA